MKKYLKGVYEVFAKGEKLALVWHSTQYSVSYPTLAAMFRAQG